LHCTPKNPACDTCVFQKTCFAYRHGLQDQLPVKGKPAKSRTRYFYYLVMEHGDSLLMRKRDQKDIWLGLFDFYLVEKTRPVNPEKLLEDSDVKQMVRNSGGIQVSRKYKHVLTHQTIFSRFIILKRRNKLNPCKENHSFYSFQEIIELPKPVLVSRFLSEHYLL
jgi:A/G-specific adenine glycosylase